MTWRAGSDKRLAAVDGDDLTGDVVVGHEEDAEDTGRRIFTAAIAEFAEHGLAGARVGRIAEAARANKQAIHLYCCSPSWA